MGILKGTLASSFGLAGAGIGMGMIGESLDSPGLQEGGAVATGFVPIAINIGMGAYTINMLKNLKRR